MANSLITIMKWVCGIAAALPIFSPGAALPLISTGLLLALFFSRVAGKQKKEKQTVDYGTEGMCLGMCLGTAIGTSLGNNTGIGICLGMLIGLFIGTCIKKKRDRAMAKRNKVVFIVLFLLVLAGTANRGLAYSHFPLKGY